MIQNYKVAEFFKKHQLLTTEISQYKIQDILDTAIYNLGFSK
jgi:hypothetical protein